MSLKRYDILNALIKANDYHTYLEIGVQNPDNCFNLIEAKLKIAVDPVITKENYNKFPISSFVAVFEHTSDQYFQQRDANKEMASYKFDLIFIDGLHEAEQVKRDIANSLRWLSDKGTIVLHDCLPTTELMQRVPRDTKEWTGDVWKAIVAFRGDPELDINVVDTDYGVGMICRCGNKNPIYIENPTFEQLQENKQEWLNLVTAEEFKEAYA